MAGGLIELSETWDGRNLIFRPDFRRGTFLQERGLIRKFIACTSDPLMDGQDVYEQALLWGGVLEPTYETFMSPDPLPPLWGFHPSDPYATLTNHEIVQNKDSPEWWEITCNYALVPYPVDEPASWEWGDGSVELILEGAEAFVDSTGTERFATESPYPDLASGSLYPIVNSALDPFDPPPTDPEHYRVLTVTKNFAIKNCTGGGVGTGTGKSATTGTGAANVVTPRAGFDVQLIDKWYARRINSVPFIVPGVCDPFPTGTVFLAEMPKARQEFKNNIDFFTTTWVFWIRMRGWNLRIADLGFRKNAVQGVPGYISGELPVPIFFGPQPIQNPAKLTSTGDVAEIGDPVNFLNYRIRKKANFNDLDLFEGLL